MKIIETTLRSIKHKVRHEASSAPMKRLAVALAKWKNNADSPVMLMIDDFTNAWVKNSSDDPVTPRCDWGGLLDKNNSIFEFLELNLFLPFPEIRTTFFTVIGKISQYNIHQPFYYAEPINKDTASIEFFKKIFNDPRFEIAYHGFNHGTPGETTESFLQEWDGFRSVDEAKEQIRKGLAICEEVFGILPAGGKYGGWQYNNLADESIDISGFHWWCRDWMPKDIDGSVIPEYFETHFFGKNRIVALPSTVHGWNWSVRQLNRLLDHRQLISIEEHMGCLRPDKRVQTPNVYDDINSLKSLFSYLRHKNVWHATGSQIADYAETYMNTSLSDIGVDSFQVHYSGNRNQPMVTLNLQMIADQTRPISNLRLIQPDGTRVEGKKINQNGVFQFNINVQSGKYKIEDE